MDELIKYDAEKNIHPELAERFDKESRMNMEGVQARVPRVKMPTGRSRIFAVESPGEEDKETNEIVGVILYQTPSNAYWESPFGSQAVIPDCASHDGIKPSNQYNKIQSLDCASCKHNRFGSAQSPSGEKLPGKACRNVKRILILRPNEPSLPVILTAPPSSIKGFDDYMVLLRKERRPYYSVATKLTLVTEKSKQGIEFPHLEFSTAGFINSADTLKQIISLRSEWMDVLKSILFSNLDEVGGSVTEGNFSVPTSNEVEKGVIPF